MRGLRCSSNKVSTRWVIWPEYDLPRHHLVCLKFVECQRMLNAMHQCTSRTGVNHYWPFKYKANKLDVCSYMYFFLKRFNCINDYDLIRPPVYSSFRCMYTQCHPLKQGKMSTGFSWGPVLLPTSQGMGLESVPRWLTVSAGSWAGSENFCWTPIQGKVSLFNGLSTKPLQRTPN